MIMIKIIALLVTLKNIKRFLAWQEEISHSKSLLEQELRQKLQNRIFQLSSNDYVQSTMFPYVFQENNYEHI